MQDFWLYFELGYKHIADWRGYDHILFVAALCLRYLLKDWRKVLILVTAFTIGHSLTLALSIFNVVNLPGRWIEFLIGVSILITAVSNLWQKEFQPRSKIPIIYMFALFFGLIHGLGFSNYLKSLLGQQTGIAGELLAFNLGLELGQLLIVAIILLITWVCINLFKIARRDYMLFVSGCIFSLALLMVIERIPK